MINYISDIVNRLETLNVTFAYDHFKTAKETPFLCYKIDEIKTSGADNKSLLKNHSVIVELYTKERDFDFENRILALFEDVEISASNVFIKLEEIYVTYFEFEFIEKI